MLMRSKDGLRLIAAAQLPMGLIAKQVCHLAQGEVLQTASRHTVGEHRIIIK